MNFVTVMIIVIAVLSVFGLCLIIYMVKYPSYDYPEKLQKRKNLRKPEKTTVENIGDEDKVGRLEHLPFDGTTFR